MGPPHRLPRNARKNDRQTTGQTQETRRRTPPADFYGDPSGDLLIVGWGSTFGPIREAVDHLRSEGHKVSSVHIRHIHPIRADIGDIFKKFKHILVPEMNDEGMYGYGQLAMLLRATTCNPAIQSLNKVQGLTFRVKEIVVKAEQVLASQ